MSDEFIYHGPLPRSGLTSVEAVRLLKKECPAVSDWTCWKPEHDHFAKMLKAGDAGHGAVGDWAWARLPCSYPHVTYVNMERGPECLQSNWTGLLKITGPGGESFLLLSVLTSLGEVGGWYLVSTRDETVLSRFSRAVKEALGSKPPEKIIITVTNGPDLELAPQSAERVFLPKNIMEDIEQQVLTFFQSEASYKKHGIPYRRGLLFVGVPGCGKTLMIRRLVRECHRRVKASFWTIEITGKTDEDDVAHLFRAATGNAPGMIILEDLDSLTRDAHITRSSLLAHLDGIVPRQGVLVIGTTNNPQDIDPAFLHRPSRFDRVWLFRPPDHGLRKAYLQWRFPGLANELVEDMAGKTSDWTFAYLNELKTTAAILAIQDGAAVIESRHAAKAYELLSTQFSSGRKHHPLPTCTSELGFDAK